jgi:HlyD family secretion protein
MVSWSRLDREAAMRRVLLSFAVGLSACQPAPEAALGTLERDRIVLPTPESERIAEVRVREGQSVRAGEVLVRLENARVRARRDAASADAARLQSLVDEAVAGPREERLTAARAQLARGQSVATNARRERERVDALVARGLLPQAERDRARSASQAADAEVRVALAALQELEAGTRVETVAQAEAALASAQARVMASDVDLERTELTAPRDGVVESLPFEVGDQPAIGAPLAILLVGERPYARVYVPQPLRLDLKIGDAANVMVQGRDRVYTGRVRAIRSEASFTPYYALSGQDAAQLSYLAEIELGAGASDLPLGLPLRAEFPRPKPP